MDKNKAVYKIIQGILHFLIHSSFLFTVCVMGTVHVVLLVTMYLTQVMPLVYFNMVSIIIYTFCILSVAQGHVLQAYIALTMEVMSYSFVSTYYTGWDCGSCFYLCSIVPIIIYFGCHIFKGAYRFIIAFLLAVDFAGYSVLYTAFRNRMPVFDIDDGVKVFLFLFASFIMVFSVIFYNAIYIYASEDREKSLRITNKKLSEDANIDTLTGLLNRRGFLPIIEELMNDKDSLFFISFIDIDNFKRVNDSYGHDGGDEVLKHISGIIKREMRGAEVCRWGGEEMVILMRDMTMEAARNKMEHLRAFVEGTPTVFYNKLIRTTITIGLTENIQDCQNASELIKKADDRMYYGKQHGKNIVIMEDG